MQKILKSCQDQLPAGDYEILRRTMDYQEQCVRVWRYHTEAFFRYRLYRLNQPGGNYESLIRACDTPGHSAIPARTQHSFFIIQFRDGLDGAGQEILPGM